MAQELNLSNLKPAAARRARKRIGRGLGSGKGRYAGRGIKGQKARSGSHKMRPGFEGGQNPIYMRLGKQRGPYSKDAMPIGPHRTHAQAVNVRDLERFDGEVTPEALKKAGLVRSTRVDVKILGGGDLTKNLAVSAHLFSATAREKIEKAGGSITWLRGEPKPKPRKQRKRPPKETAVEPAEAEADEETEPAEEPVSEEPVSDTETVSDTENEEAEETEQAEQPEEES
jgi:large subunit ribosomal protein L15